MEVYELGVEFRQAGLAGVVEDKNGVDHFQWIRKAKLEVTVGQSTK